jgi:LmbE family N-acetylglucosaminyl deacetylase
MMGEPTNANPASFWRADHEEATGRLVAILEEVRADVLTIYDDHGGYGHPDHIRVHTVGLAAARAMDIQHVFEATINRDEIARLRSTAESAADEPAEDPPADGTSEVEGPDVDPETFGTPTARIAYRVDVIDVLDRKRAAMAAHRSQIGPDSFFLAMPETSFAVAFGAEWFNVPGDDRTHGPSDVELLPGLY